MRDMPSSPASCSGTSSPCLLPPCGEVTAVILAAGFSSRMGSFKPLLPLAGQTALERCVRLFRDAGVDDIRVVIGHRGDALRPLLRSMDVRFIENEHPERGMFSSVRCALRDMLSQPRQGAASTSSRGCLLLPVDIAAIRPRTVTCLRDAWRRGEAPVILPSFMGKTGHPAFLATTTFEDILAWDGENGLRGWMERRFPDGPATVPVADAGILMDMDAPDDAAGMARRLDRTLDLSIPDAEECLALHQFYDPGPHRRRVHAHCLATARAALRLGTAIIQAGHEVSLELLASVALVHDVAKGAPDHSRAGAAFLRGQGFPDLADIVAAHHGPHILDGHEIDATAVLQLADLLVLEDRVVGLKERFAATAQRHGDNARTLITIREKFGLARLLCRRMEELGGRNPEAIVLDPIPREDELLRGFTI